MGAERNRIVVQEAEAWRREGRIDEEFLTWIQKRYPTEGDEGTQRLLQRILIALAGILVLVGIFTLVAQYWSEFAREAKLLILLAFAAAAGAAGVLLGFLPATRLISHGLVPLTLPLYLFAMEYVSDPPLYEAANPLTAPEVAALAGGILLGLAGLFLGLWRYPGLALASGPTLGFTLTHLESYAQYTRGLHLTVLWTVLLLVLVLHVFYALLWLGKLPLGYSWRAFSARLGWAANVPFGFASIMELVDTYGWQEPNRVVYDTTYVGVAVSAAYAAILLLSGLRLGLPELTLVCGVLLVGDALWLGGSKGGVLGVVFAIFGAATLLGVLAQQGVLGRIFRPRPPPAHART